MNLIALYIALALLGGDSMEGYAPRYSPGVMERVADIRQMAHAECMVSSAYYPIGTEVYVWGKRTYTLRKCIVTDVSAPKDKARHRKTKRIIELGYTEALDICGKKYINSASKECPVIVIRLNQEGL